MTTTHEWFDVLAARARTLMPVLVEAFHARQSTLAGMEASLDLSRSARWCAQVLDLSEALLKVPDRSTHHLQLYVRDCLDAGIADPARGISAFDWALHDTFPAEYSPHWTRLSAQSVVMVRAIAERMKR